MPKRRLRSEGMGKSRRERFAPSYEDDLPNTSTKSERYEKRQILPRALARLSANDALRCLGQVLHQVAALVDEDLLDGRAIRSPSIASNSLASWPLPRPDASK